MRARVWEEAWDRLGGPWAIHRPPALDKGAARP